MKVLRFYAPGDVRIEEAPKPQITADEVLIRVRNCSTCGTDVKIFHNGHQNITPPRVMGTKWPARCPRSGRTSPAGRSATASRSSQPSVRRVLRVPKGVDGGLREPDVHRLPVRRRVRRVHGGAAGRPQGRRAEPDPGRGGLRRSVRCEPFACAINAQELLGIDEGDTVVVFGAGPIGCIHTRIARGVH